MSLKVFLFGEAEKGDFCVPYHCHSLAELAEVFGNPPEETLGLIYAVQALLYQRELIYFRVQEEGFSTADYMKGIQFLRKKEHARGLSAIGMPGVGDAEILQATIPICSLHNTLLITTEKDLYDYLTHGNK
jgi:hypothetical protein